MFLTSDFVLGGFASVGATYFTNPFEVIKTRIQLQGELAEPGTYSTPYKSVMGAFTAVAKNEGISGLQKGLVPAFFFQFIMSAFRLSVFTYAKDKSWTQNENGQISFVRGAFWGGIGSIIGAFFSSPFLLVKTQMQAQADKSIAVGYQHKHLSTMNAFKHIYAKGGFFGLWNGVWAAIPRSFLGGSSQIGAYAWVKSVLKERGLVTNPTMSSFCAGLVAGSVMSVAITPPDVITTRLYNQHVDKNGRGALYNGWLDCFRKILKTEGIFGLYKGFWPNYLRFAPHSTLSLLFFDELLILRERYEKKSN